MTYRYKRTEPTLWTVGTDVDGKWEPESDHGSPEEAADRVRWLNGGQDATPTLADDLLERIETAEQERDRLAAELEEVRHHLAKAISARQDAEHRLAAVTRERDEARVIAYEYRRVERGNFLLYIHTCGQTEWFDAAPSDGGCDACESGSENPADWTLLYTKLNTAAAASGLGSPRRAQDGQAEPSQGQEIPDAQLAAILAEAESVHLSGGVRQALQSAYRIGYAAALGYEIEIIDGRVGVGDRPEPAAQGNELAEARREITRLTAERDEARQDYRDLTDRFDRLRQHLGALNAASSFGIRLTIADPAGPHPMDRPTGSITVLGFEYAPTARQVGVVLSQALADYVGDRVDATLIDPPAKLGDPPAVDVQALLEETRAALAAADSDQDRTDIVEELLEGWYAAWPDTALTSPHQAIAGELVRLLQPGPVTLTIPSDLWAGLAQRIRAGHSEAPS